MLKRIFFFVIPLFVFSSAFAKTQWVGQFPVVPLSSTKMSVYRLDNGLQVAVIPDKRNTLASLHFILNAGSNREQLGTTGLAHFFEHMMFRKTKGFEEGHYDRVLNAVGGSGNAGTSDSFVTFYSRFPAPALEQILKLESDRFLRLDLADPYFTVEKGAVISERKLRVENDPIQRSTEVLRSIAERDTTRQWMTIGSKSDVEHMSLASAQTFYDTYYVPNNTIMVIGGPFESQKVLDLVEKYFSTWQKKPLPILSPLPKDYFTRDLGKSFVCGAQTQMKQYQLIYPSWTNQLKDTVYAQVFQAVLDDNPNGTFEYRLIKQNLAHHFSFYKTFWQAQSYPIVVGFQLSSDQDFQKANDMWLSAVHSILQQSISAKIKSQVLKQLRVEESNTAEKMTSLLETALDNMFFFQDPQMSGKAEGIVQKMTTEDFHAWVKSNLAKSYTMGIVPLGKNVTPCAEYAEHFFSEKKP